PPAGADPCAFGCAGPRSAFRQPVSLHGLPEDPRCGPAGLLPCHHTGRAMTKVLIESSDVVVTMDDANTEIAGGSILIEDGMITWVGTGTAPGGIDGVEVIDGRGAVATPGLINVHHHLYQALTRVRAQDQTLFGWLTQLYPVWAGVDAEWERAAASVGLAELAL